MPVPQTPIQLLSGGNMQKLILGRALDPETRASSSPTSRRAASMSAPSPMCSSCSRRAARGAAILLISEDLDELLALSDRVAVMSNRCRRLRAAATAAIDLRSSGTDDGRRYAGAHACVLSPVPARRAGCRCGARLARSSPRCSPRPPWIWRSPARRRSRLRLVTKGRARLAIRALETLTRATPLIFTGLAAAVAFRARLWNIGAEAQLYIGAVVTTVLGHRRPRPAGSPLIPVLIVAGALGRRAAAARPGAAEDRFGVDEVVTTLLLNFIVLLFVSMLLEGPLKDPMGLGWPQSSRR
jgi:hypothetical protein